MRNRVFPCRWLIVGALLALALPDLALAHGGGLDRNGCHNNRRTGDYHCHRDGPGIPVTPRFFSSPRNALPAVPQVAVPRVAAPYRSQLVRDMQVGLIRLGYTLPAPDNIMGPLTQFAIMKFQESEGLAIDGEPSDVLLRLIEARAAARGQ